ncbi:hypothetical protein FOCC_FOCC008220 [Frankliniella occidentalis]|nr:hypothetical protein FOCC_FOCC008220 [Frankliniella occidentalis]
MVIRVYVSGISGNKEVKKRQQRVLMILESKNIPCEIIDITEPGKESDKEFMQQNSKPRGDQKHPLPPQIFNDDEYCGEVCLVCKDFIGFDLSNENEKLLPFLKMAVPEPSPPPQPKEESDDESKRPEEESEEESEEETKPSRPRPRPPTKVVTEDDSNANGDGNDDEV